MSIYKMGVGARELAVVVAADERGIHGAGRAPASARSS